MKVVRGALIAGAATIIIPGAVHAFAPVGGFEAVTSNVIVPACKPVLTWAMSQFGFYQMLVGVIIGYVAIYEDREERIMILTKLMVAFYGMHVVLILALQYRPHPFPDVPATGFAVLRLVIHAFALLKLCLNAQGSAVGKRKSKRAVSTPKSKQKAHTNPVEYSPARFTRSHTRKHTKET